MAHIGCIIEDENGNCLIDSELNFAQIHKILWEIDPKKLAYPWLLTITPYGDSTFNILQRPYLLNELKKLSHEVGKNIVKDIDSFISFIETKDSDHVYLKFIGD